MRALTKQKPAIAHFETSESVYSHLNQGIIESASISEALLVETPELLELVCPESYKYVKNIFDHGDSIYKFYEIAALGLLTRHGEAGYKDWIYHSSDTVRCWVAYWIASNTGLGFNEQLKQIEPLADDSHFWVRENACMAMRPLLINNLDKAIKTLEKWAKSDNPNLRRFALEITRPKGFWSTHLADLQKDPNAALPILEAVRFESNRYVQEAMVNWFIDAEDLHPGWSKNILDVWHNSPYYRESNWVYKKVFEPLR